jgi:hypothetical protein
MVLDGVGGRAEGVADACGRETVKLGDLARMGRRTPLRCASVEDLDGGDRFSGAVSARSRRRSRVRNVPENRRTKTIFSRFGPRSILNTVPDAGPVVMSSAEGSSFGIAWRRSATPTPVNAAPKYTGRTCN